MAAKKQPTDRRAVHGKPPTKAQRQQAQLRRSAKAAGLPPSEAGLTPFVEVFCQEYVRIGILSDAHQMAERRCREPLSFEGFTVEQETNLVAGRKVKTMHITDPLTGRQVYEGEIRSARAAGLYAMPEVKARIKTLRKVIADGIEVTALSLAQECALVFNHAIAAGEHQVAANLIALKGKLFGIEAGSGGDGAGAPASSVNINIRDFTGKKA